MPSEPQTITRAITRTTPSATDNDEDLRARMTRPQRHRLLHGYPMAPLLTHERANARLPWRRLALETNRPMLLGVLPHTFCNPAVRGCGFCTFPHEKHSNDAARAVAKRVAREVRDVREMFPEAMLRSVPALYFGGGTANLTPPDAFSALADALAETFDLRESEISLEGVARYFLTRGEALLDILQAMPAKKKRISVGVQSFDPEWLARMGRTAFGDVETFRAVVRAAHARAMTVSCDLLYNLPGQSIDASLCDVQKAIDLGFDQICIYNLVLDPSIDSEWAHSRSLLALRSPPEVACERWLLLRERLLEMGYDQTTLTNFERKNSARFVYERASFDPATNDALGFGPGAISTFTATSHDKAIKWMNAGTSAEYEKLHESRGHAVARSFTYAPIDLRLLHITRALSAMSITRNVYRAFFGNDIELDFADEIDAVTRAGLCDLREHVPCESQGLVTRNAASGAGGENARDALALTPQGIFYADAVAGLFASRRARALRDANDSIAHAMG